MNKYLVLALVGATLALSSIAMTAPKPQQPAKPQPVRDEFAAAHRDLQKAPRAEIPATF
jgi:hypothetical protein